MAHGFLEKYIYIYLISYDAWYLCLCGSTALSAALPLSGKFVFCSGTALSAALLAVVCAVRKGVAESQKKARRRELMYFEVMENDHG